MDENIKREIILDNYQDPYNKGLIDDKDYSKTNTRSDSCIDNLDVIMKKNKDIIEDIRFDGEACAISTSATSLLIKNIIGKTSKEAKEILINYKKMIDNEDYDEDLLGELNVYNEIYKQPNRKNCALLPSVAIEKLIGGIDDGSK